EHDVGRLGDHGLERGLAVVGLADHRQPRVDRQRCPKTRPEEHLGIDDQDRCGLRCIYQRTPAARYPTLASVEGRTCRVASRLIASVQPLGSPGTITTRSWVR